MFYIRRCICVLVLCFLPLFCVYADYADAEKSIIVLRDLLYEQNLSANDLIPFYKDTLKDIEKADDTSNNVRKMALKARAEYFMGRAYQYEEQKEEAIIHYENGIKFSDSSLESQKNPLALLMKAECISQLCAIKPTSYAMSNGLKVIALADEVLTLDTQNTAAIYMKASRWIYSPALFADQNKGRKILLDNSKYLKLDNKDDVFNFNLAIGYSFLRSKKKKDALVYLQKALELYPTNRYCASLITDASE